jgi:hypothetical protein
VSIISGGGNDSDLSSSSTTYIGMLDDISSSTESAVQQAIPVDGTISRFYVRTGGDVGSTGDTYTFTVRVNGADSLVTCTITGVVTTVEQSCSDLTNSVAVSAGNLISISSVPASSPSGSPDAHWTAKFVAN